MDRFILPNLHAVLIHFPIALLTIGVLVELFSCRCGANAGLQGQSCRNAGRWMILLGALFLLPTATTGLYALHDVAAHGSESIGWADARQNIPADVWPLVRLHVVLNFAGAVLALIGVMAFVSASDGGRQRLRGPCLIILIVALGLISVGAWHGGEMVFRQGFGVEGRMGVLPPQPTEPQTMRDRIEYYLAPYQAHVFMAGVVMSLIALGLALSLRKAAMLREWEERILVAPTPIPAPASPPALPEYPIRPLTPTPRAAALLGQLPHASCFWLIAALAALATISLGLYIGGYYVWPQMLNWSDIQENVRGIHWSDNGREGLHLVGAGVILLLPLLMSALARWAPRQRIAVGVLVLLLVAVIALQVWMGVLLLYDGPQGPLNAFRPPGS